MTQKLCTQCEIEKDFDDDFCKDLSRPDGKHPICKECQKINRKATGYHSSQKYYKRVYKGARIKDTYARNKCLGYADDGTPCKRKPIKGSFCPRCERRRQFILDNHDLND